MNTLRGLLKRTVALMIIFIMMIGQMGTISSYAVDAINSSNENIEILAYFEDEKGNKTSNAKKSIDETLILKLDVTVKNEKGLGGYFDGNIDLRDCNFKLKEDDSISVHINAGETKTIEKEIKCIDNLSEENLNKDSTIILSGKYINSNDEYDVRETATVTVNWMSKEDVEAKMQMQVLTNNTYTASEQSKRILQLLVNNSLKNSSYPMKNNKIEIDMPDGVKGVEVRGINGNIISDIKEETSKLIINAEKETDIIITYELNEDAEITEINGSGIVTLYDEKELQTESNIKIGKKIDGSVTGKIIEKETEIYKGKLYAGEERPYTSTTQININYAEGTDKIEVNEEIEEIANYVETKINKQEIIKILGNEGYILVEDEEGNVVANITDESEVDDDGNIVIKYADEVRKIKITTNKPIANGMLNIVNKKIIKTNYERNQIKDINKLEEKVSINGKESKTDIILKEPESVANLILDNETISTVAENQKLRITVKLNAENEKEELYKNPKIKITLPKEITGLTIEQSKALYTNGLEIKSANVSKNKNEEFELNIVLFGEQVKYDTTGGTELVIDLNVEASKLIPSRTSIINMEYTNENNDEQKEIKKELKFEAEYGIIMYNQVSNFNKEGTSIETTDEILEAKLDIDAESIETEIKTVLINNYEEDVKNIAIIGRVPGTNINAQIKNIKVNNKNAKIYYSSNIDATAADESWTENGVNAVAYKVEIESVKSKENIQVTTTVEIPEKLTTNMSENITEEAIYSYRNQEQTKNASIILKTEQIMMARRMLSNALASKSISVTTSQQSGGPQITSRAYAGNELLDKDVYEGQTIKYEITIKNNTEKDFKNITAKVIQTNGKMWDLVKVEGFNQGTGEITNEEFYKLTDRNEKVLGTIESLKAGDSVIYEYETTVDVLQDNTNAKTYGTLYLQSEDEKLNSNSQLISYNVNDAALQLKLEEGKSNVDLWYENNLAYSNLEIKNLTSKELSNVAVKIAFSPNLTIKADSDHFETGKYVNRVKFVNVEKNSEGESIVTLNITKISANESIGMSIYATINNYDEKNPNVEMFAQSTIGSETYSSNKMSRITYKSIKNTIDVSMQGKINGNTNITDKTVAKNGDKVSFISTIKNTRSGEATVVITNKLIDGVIFEKATLIKDGKETDISSSVKKKNLSTTQKIPANSSIQIKIDAKINTDYLVSKDITNEVIVRDLNYATSKKATIVFTTGKETKTSNSTSTEKTDNNTSTEVDEDGVKYYTISGKTWIDANANGKRDSNEENIGNITVKAINTEKGTIVNTTSITSSDGEYSMKLAEGKYIILFLYDNSIYYVTTYQINGSSDFENSDAITRNLTMDGVKTTVAATDILKLTSNQSNIDLGLIRRGKFDLNIEKYVNQIIVTNVKGTTTYSQENDTKLAKVEIPSKYINGSNVVIEYKVKVSNVGEVAGYATRIVDYLPSTLSFSSSLNPDWYQSGENIYSTALANSIIEPGESKELKLIVTKTMTSSNTGLINNQVQIESSTNSQGLKDSTNNKGSADVLLLISTGATISYIITVSLIIIALCGVIYIIYKKVFNKRLKI